MKKEQQHSMSITATPRVSTIRVISGVLFSIIWIIAHGVWGMIAFVANVMGAAGYNPGGPPTNTEAGTLIFGMIIGQIIAGLAGLPGGAAFYQPDRRKRLLILFAGMFVTGALIQVGVFIFFFTR